MAGQRTLTSGTPRDWNMGNILSECSQEQGERFAAWVPFRGGVRLSWIVSHGFGCKLWYVIGEELIV